MNLADLHRQLIRVAQANPPSAAVPYAFEKRVMACLAAAAKLDHWALWSRVLWRAAVPCVAVMVLVSAWTLFIEKNSAPRDPLDTVIENTVLAAIDHPGDPW